MRRHLAVVLFIAAASGCGKKTWPPYYQLDAQQSVLLARDGDPAYESPELEQIIVALNAAPENARERDQALALAAKLTAARDRLRAEREERMRPRVAPLTALAPPPPAPEEASGAPDAGAGPPAALPEKPFAGMDERIFVSAFGACFSPGPASTTDDGKPASTQRLVGANDSCVKRFAAQQPPGANLDFLFVGGKLWGTRVEEVRLVDAGSRSLPVLDAGIVLLDAGVEARIAIPGMPFE